MTSRNDNRMILIVSAVFLGLATLFPAVPAIGEGQTIQIESGHLWRPPLGLDRVGRPLDAVVSIGGKPPAGEFVRNNDTSKDSALPPPIQSMSNMLVGYRDGKEVSRQGLTWMEQTLNSG